MVNISIGCALPRKRTPNQIANKDTLIAQSFRVTLRHGARSVERVSKLDGRLIPVASNATSFATGMISPGGGELFKLAAPAPR